MRLRFASIVIGLALLQPSCGIAGEVIVNESVHLAPGDIRDAFLGEKQFADGVRLVPVDNTMVQDDFLAKVLQTDNQKYYARWARKSFREGIGAPAVKRSDAEVIAFVRSTHGAIGYIGRSANGVTVLLSF